MQQKGAQHTPHARRCAVHPLTVLIILSLGVEEWGGEKETGWLTQHPPSTENRWDLTPSTQITAKEASACSCDNFKVTTTVYSNMRRVPRWGDEGNIETLQPSHGKINKKLTALQSVTVECHNLCKKKKKKRLMIPPLRFSFFDYSSECIIDFVMTYIGLIFTTISRLCFWA